MYYLYEKGFSQTYVNMKKRLLLAISVTELMVIRLAVNTATIS